jgi:hypothetical protein
LADATPQNAPPGAIPVEQLITGLRTEMHKNEHVLWQGRGSGRAFNAFNRGLLLRFGLIIIGFALVLWWMLDNPNPSNNWLAWILVLILVGRFALFFWQSSATPKRQVAMLTTRRLLSVDIVRPETNWTIAIGGEGHAEGQYADPHPIVVTGTKERGHIKLNRSIGKVRAYPPFILFNAARPLELAKLIKSTLKIDQPIEDRTK